MFLLKRQRAKGNGDFHRAQQRFPIFAERWNMHPPTPVLQLARQPLIKLDITRPVRVFRDQAHYGPASSKKVERPLNMAVMRQSVLRGITLFQVKTKELPIRLILGLKIDVHSQRKAFCSC